MVEVKFTLFNRDTVSSLSGVLRFKGGSFHEIVDDLPRRIRKRMHGWLRANFPGESAESWRHIEVLGYQKYDLWAGRVLRATGKLPKLKPTNKKKRGKK